jgi:hypothetical protein
LFAKLRLSLRKRDANTSIRYKPRPSGVLVHDDSLSPTTRY